MKILVCALLLVAATLAQDAEQDRANVEEGVKRVLMAQLVSTLMGLTPSDGNTLDISTMKNLVDLLASKNSASPLITNNDIQNEASEVDQSSSSGSNFDENSFAVNFNALDDPKYSARAPVYTTTAKPIPESNPVDRNEPQPASVPVNEPLQVPVQISYLTGKDGSLPYNILVGLKVPLPYYNIELSGSNSAPVPVSPVPARDQIPIVEQDPESSEPVVREQRYVPDSPVWFRQQFRRRNSPFLNLY
ncbi:uncharacterized protein LOC130897182 [Diorhabda carinulata]|uniref:uncharacterized protein LOC130897182 n=1 Tax=Diorhabda carinulata TaxID=1163345 RepID=UPI0025A0E914|nr:uncharacterized protein LOC130897182 [Diorhabda carinulata]